MLKHIKIKKIENLVTPTAPKITNILLIFTENEI